MKLSLLIATFLFIKYASSTITVYDEKNLTLIDYDDSSAAFGPRLPENGFKVVEEETKIQIFIILTKNFLN